MDAYEASIKLRSYLLAHEKAVLKIQQLGNA